jgi:hypothetical protein
VFAVAVVLVTLAVFLGAVAVTRRRSLDVFPLALGAWVMVVLAALTALWGIDDDTKRKSIKRIEARYMVEVVDDDEFPSRLFVRRAGELLQCTLTADEEHLVCDGAVVPVADPPETA